MLGVLDDLILLPGLIWLAIRLIPPEVGAIAVSSAHCLLSLRLMLFQTAPYQELQPGALFASFLCEDIYSLIAT